MQINMKPAAGVSTLLQIALAVAVSSGVMPTVCMNPTRFDTTLRMVLLLLAGRGYVISTACSKLTGVRGPMLNPRAAQATNTDVESPGRAVPSTAKQVTKVIQEKTLCSVRYALVDSTIGAATKQPMAFAPMKTALAMPARRLL